jgi:uncharacterized phage infection (PIP) family protein YhgE
VLTPTVVEQHLLGLQALSGALNSARNQTQIVTQHMAFVRQALEQTDLVEARRHAEHIINILDGKEGFMYGDLDRDGLTENPGDGVGVRIYLDEAHQAALELVNVSSAFSLLSDYQTKVQMMVQSIENSQNNVSSSFDDALQIFASDTVTEATSHAEDLTSIVNDLNSQIEQASSITLQIAQNARP